MNNLKQHLSEALKKKRTLFWPRNCRLGEMAVLVGKVVYAFEMQSTPGQVTIWKRRRERKLQPKRAKITESQLRCYNFVK